MFSEHPLAVPDSLGKRLLTTSNPAEPSPGGNEALPPRYAGQEGTAAPSVEGSRHLLSCPVWKEGLNTRK